MRNTENIFKYKEVVVKKSHGYTQVWLFTNSPSRNAVGVKVWLIDGLFQFRS